jgi:hypothetical protein
MSQVRAPSPALRYTLLDGFSSSASAGVELRDIRTREHLGNTKICNFPTGFLKDGLEWYGSRGPRALEFACVVAPDDLRRTAGIGRHRRGRSMALKRDVRVTSGRRRCAPNAGGLSRGIEDPSAPVGRIDRRPSPRRSHRESDAPGPVEVSRSTRSSASGTTTGTSRPVRAVVVGRYSPATHTRSAFGVPPPRASSRTQWPIGHIRCPSDQTRGRIAGSVRTLESAHPKSETES